MSTFCRKTTVLLSTSMALLNSEQDQDYLVASYKSKKNELSVKYISDLSSVDFRNDYLHFKEKLEPTPIQIRRIYERHQEYTQYFVLEKNDLDEYESCCFYMMGAHSVSITQTQNGHYHGIIKQEDEIVWEEIIESEDMDVFVCVIHIKAMFDKFRRFKRETQLAATFKLI